ncbi:MAG: hypothetical protein RL318_2598 [Fibrobacterota bacterium]
MNRAQALREIELLENFEFDRGDAAARLLHHLQTEDMEVVHAALRAAVNYFGFPGVYEQVFQMARESDDEDVRAAANAALWPVIQDGASYELPVEPSAEALEPGVPREVYEQTRNHLLAKVDAPMESMEVRRRCLEALGHVSFLPEIRSIILRFYHEAPNPWVKLSSVYAMGLCKDDVFERLILEELHSEHTGILVEAVHAASNLGLEAAWLRIRELTAHADRDVRFEAIAAIGSIAPVDEAKTLLDTLAPSLVKHDHYGQAFEFATQTLEARRAIDAGDEWTMEKVWDEIDEMTGFGENDDYESASDGPSSPL